MTKLSDRVRPDVEAAPWVIEEIKRLEAALAQQSELGNASKSEQLLASHDHAVRAEFQRTKASLAQQGEHQPVVYVLSPVDIYDFAGWLTTRAGVMEVGKSKEAGPMAEAVGEYLRLYPERFKAAPAAQPLTDEQIEKIEAEIWNMDFMDDTERKSNREFVRAIERHHGIGADK